MFVAMPCVLLRLACTQELVELLPPQLLLPLMMSRSHSTLQEVSPTLLLPLVPPLLLQHLPLMVPQPLLLLPQTLRHVPQTPLLPLSSLLSLLLMLLELHAKSLLLRLPQAPASSPT